MISDTYSLTQEEKEEIMDMINDNPFHRLHEDFSSKYKIGKFVENSDHYIPPVTVKLPARGDGHIPTFQMVPLTELIPAVFSQAGFASSAAVSEPGVLHDFADGSSMKENPFFQASVLFILFLNCLCHCE